MMVKLKAGDLSSKEIERAKLVFDIYDFEGNAKMDAVNLGDALRALELNPTLAIIEKQGGTKKKGEKQLSIEEFLPIYGQVKVMKDVGTFEDFMEGLKVYDKAENGQMLAAELAHVLLTLGERLTDPQVVEILKLAGPEDDDGFVKYEPWVKTVLAGPFPKTDD
ncbi:myosin light chain 1 [Chamberlinius hualienensis]